MSRLRSALIEKAIYQVDEEFDRVVGGLCGAFQHFNKKPAEEFSFMDLIEAIRWFPDRIIDVHFRSQVSFLSGKYDRVIQFEDRSAVSEFFEASGMKLHTLDAHRVSGRAGVAKFVAPDEPIRAVRAQFAANPDVPHAFSLEIESALEGLVADRYAHDLALWRDLTSEGLKRA